MVSELKTRNEELAARGVYDYASAIQTGALAEGEEVGTLVMLRFCNSQQLPLDTLRDIYLGAALSEDDLPRPRSASDAWRLATKRLEGKEIPSQYGGSVKVLVRDWNGGHDPRRDLTLERQEKHNDRFSYASPAAVITFDKKSERMAWDNRLPYGSDEYQIIEGMLDEARARFALYRRYVDGEAIYRSIKRLLERRQSLPMGQGDYLIWSEHGDLVKAISSVVAAMNESSDEDLPNSHPSAVRIFTVVNTQADRQTLSEALDQTIKKEVEEALERMARIMSDETRLIDSQGALELANMERLQGMVKQYRARFEQDTRTITTQLDLLWDQHMDLMQAIATNNARKAREKEQAQKGKKGA